MSQFEAELDHVVVAGSATLLPLLPRRKDIGKIKEAPTIEKPWEAYYRHVAKSSDIDLFLYGLESEDDAIKLIYEIERQVRERQGLAQGAGLTLRSENAITFIAPRWPYRHIQVQHVGDLQGLARLLWSEYNVKGRFTVYRIARHRYLRTLMRINDVNVNPSSPSAYAAYDVPYGERYDAEEIRKFILSSFPNAFFGTVREAVPLDEEANEEDSRSGRVRFLVHDPGRQMIGSHNPIVTEDDWTEDAYI
ncbi:uncharacterized protein FIESC28_01463 [Fusarium coffeatum]|uniref:Uncharacterized protein n=1 Tax=Fusarium coffeatum TaxID=231269 RepID=A0A366SAH2_9HYPO|nr:uncharacterized protein FIESC28_01463 [Fusarium coffeatum]RBR25710.1 hypothetical protein FIESC28_01463 [Fusarium coffeatum]